ncbi:MAG: hypothetical protein JJU11_15595 [Candidatus Sumerlaeia bacterium]|nr:hypothetical protein [Candidatus Sumerlaeia bacterium]
MSFIPQLCSLTRILICTTFLLAVTPVTAFNFISVDTGSDVVDAPDLTPMGLLLDPGSDGRISLREAILANNNAPPGATVSIMISGETIRPLTELPPFTRGPVSVFASGGVVIDGSLMTETGAGLTIASERVRIAGFTVKNFPGDGLRVVGDRINDSNFGLMRVHGNSGHGLVLNFLNGSCMPYCFRVYNSDFFDNSKSAILSRSGNVSVSDTRISEGTSKSLTPNGGFGVHLDPSGASQLQIGPDSGFVDQEFGHVIEVLEGERVEIASTLSIPDGGTGRWYFNQEMLIPEDTSTTLTINAIPFSRAGRFEYRITDSADLVTTRSPSVDVIVRSPAEVHAPENLLLAFFQLNRSGDPYHLTIDDARQITDHPSIIDAFEELDANNDGILSINEVYRDLFDRARYTVGRVDLFLNDLSNETATTSTLNLNINVGSNANRPLRVLDVMTFHGSQFTQFFPPAGEGTIQPGDSWVIDLDFNTQALLADAGFILLETDSFVLPYVLIPLVTETFQQRLELERVILGRKRIGEDEAVALDMNRDGLIDSADLIALRMEEQKNTPNLFSQPRPATNKVSDDQLPIAGDLLISTTGYVNRATE